MHSREQALRDGLNCVALAHLAIKDLYGYELPDDLFCTELFQDRTHTRPIALNEQRVPGDLYWFGQPANDAFVPDYVHGRITNWKHSPLQHVAIFTGYHMGDEPLLLHATHRAGTNVIWPLKQFSSYRKYARLLGVSRLREAG